ncbi:hypothetical protein [Flexithrix dorotheae]|uniref:hypothetical protein n=1 Tax=Flexithrix dorotheae TaxID=70993 RepID=UPI000363AD68|nr:hypothetical protein [Flexithrix dorotheae]
MSEKYWQEIRIEYVSKAEILPKLCHQLGWEFLGNATIGPELVAQIRDEENKIRIEFPEVVEEYEKGLDRFYYKRLRNKS